MPKKKKKIREEAFVELKKGPSGDRTQAAKDLSEG